MNFTKKLLLTGLFSLFAIFILQAQKPVFKKMTPEDRANKYSARLINDLELSEAQGEKIKTINLEYTAKVKQAQEVSKTTGDKAELKEKITLFREEQKVAINAVLTPSQLEKWAELKKKPAQAPKKSKRQRFTGAKS